MLKTTDLTRGPRAALRLALLTLLAGAWFAAPARAVPLRLVQATALDSIPGTIVASLDTAWVCLERSSDNQASLLRVNRKTRAVTSLPLGLHGRGDFLGLAPDGVTVMAHEPDSAGVHWVQAASFANPNWRRVLPATDADPHITWFSDSRSFLYQDILDDARGTPSIFRMEVSQARPRLFLVGGQRPLVAPTGDAVACVTADTTSTRSSTRNLEQFQPVGVEDLKAGDFYNVAPLRTIVPDHGGWSPDGQRLALIGYDVGKDAVSHRRLYIHSRITRSNKVIDLQGDDYRTMRDSGTDLAVWSPDGEWIAVPMVTPRTGEPEVKGGIWLVGKSGADATLITPATGVWRGAPIWIGRRQLLIGDLDTFGPRKYWILDLGG